MIKWIKKIPAGLLLIPLLIGAIIHTFFPQILELGSITTAAFSNAGATAFMGVQLFCLGSALKIKQFPGILKYGMLIFLSKFLVAIFFVFLFQKMYGVQAIYGITVLALICTLSNTNGNMYLTLMSSVDDPEASAATPIITLNNGPFLPLLILGMSGVAQFEIKAFIGAILPIILGMIVGDLSNEARKFLRPGVKFMLPFIGFSLGAGINLTNALKGGSAGIVLGVMSVVISGGVSFFVVRIIGRKSGLAGIAASSVGANAVAVPAILATIDERWEPLVEASTSQIAAAVVVSAVIAPIVFTKISNKLSKND